VLKRQTDILSSGCKLSTRSTTRAQKPVRQKEKFMLFWAIYAYGHYPETHPENIQYYKKGNNPTRIWKHHNK
jgi:hypothetical protein